MTDGQILDRVLASLERRMLRREREMRAKEETVLQFRRAGTFPPRLIDEAYRDAVVRYDEARLAYIAAPCRTQEAR